MVKTGPSPQEPKSYQPSEQMQNLVEDKLRLLKNDQSDRNWDAQKSKILDKMFQSWADMIYFLESVADNPDLQDVFEDDLKELFEIKPSHKVKQLSPLFGVDLEGIRMQETSFTRFVFASLILHEEETDNFRLHLLYELQSLIYAKSWWILTRSFDPFDIIVKSALEDLQKALAWTYYLSKTTKDFTANPPSRFLDFSAPYKARLRKKRKNKSRA